MDIFVFASHGYCRIFFDKDELKHYIKYFIDERDYVDLNIKIKEMTEEENISILINLFNTYFNGAGYYIYAGPEVKYDFDKEKIWNDIKEQKEIDKII